MPKTQSASSHSAFDPVTHFVLLPVFTINFGLAIYHAVHDPQHRTLLDLWLIVLAFTLILIAGKMRGYTLRVQDRVIRLEERMRIAALVPAADANHLSLRQLIALRFASDGELPALVRQALAESLTPTQIKERITSWRPDEVRV